MRTWTVYLFSYTGKTLFEKDFQARGFQDAQRKGQRLVRPHLDRHDDAEDWVVEEKVMRNGSLQDRAMKLAIRFLLSQDGAK